MANHRIIVVTGFGRCGSSLVMQMLHAGGVPCAGEYPAFEDEHGSLILGGGELSAEEIANLDGRAVKLLDLHRGALPRGPDYRVIWMSRDHAQQAKSQAKFFSTLTGMRMGRDDVRGFARSYARDTPRLQAVINSAGATVLGQSFEGVIGAPLTAAQRIAAHVGIAPDRVADMARVVRARDAACAPDLSLELSLIAGRG